MNSINGVLIALNLTTWCGLLWLYVLLIKSRAQASSFRIHIEALTKEMQEKEANLRIYVERFMKSNENLEKLLHYRTAQLDSSYRQMDRYSYQNAHQLRAPVARLLGLANLAKHIHEPDELKRMVELIEEEAENMDSVIASLNNLLKTDKKIPT
jgi:signal transduction histidine kinase